MCSSTSWARKRPCLPIGVSSSARPGACTPMSVGSSPTRSTRAVSVSHPSCATQNTEFGTGLRWLEADHADRSTESRGGGRTGGGRDRPPDRVHSWTDQHGALAPRSAPTTSWWWLRTTTRSICCGPTCEADPRTRGVQVGTVDKFQGREAPVVFFTMTTSSARDMPRGAEFLFSRNRLNVAISRARCLAYLVCTEELLNSRACTSKTCGSSPHCARLSSTARHKFEHRLGSPIRRWCEE